MEKIEDKLELLFEETAEFWDIDIFDLNPLRQKVERLFATHTKQLCVGFGEWKDKNCELINGDMCYECMPTSNEQLYEHYLKYLKEVENGKG